MTKGFEPVVGDHVVAGGTGWFRTFQGKKATIKRVTNTSFYIVWDGSSSETGYPRRWPFKDQYFEKVS